MRARILLLGMVALVAATSATPATAVVAVSGPVAEETGYITPVLVVPQGQPLTFVNADPASYNHNLVADENFFPRGKNTAHWCAGYPATRCPVFWSDIISLGVTPVEGVPALKPGEYHFVCTLHALMVGTLIVV